ncbi:hypothetical protein LTR10_014332 [Elasticomyces elasticus]|uniref:NADH-ubiquinone oxidoreductase subunit B14.7 n=1 Tax=Exophiala sideris TaxID=1016849 RepID=A0ABR0JIP6_9EURO|nr:hypothetical protein LTR10_014332 [Elasticomyces elasticus]KAK5034374.1 hypothetical protein LTS07_003295 [Exophiala sideris]KAK5042671.1 hypothetical protein LTR13_001519 [Exophiala sideris]KAK5065753.1 hypothetical protein LTR69_003303 [Exophiala sideris]
MPEVEVKSRSSAERALLEPLLPSLGVGTATGVLGVAYGTVAGILVSTPRPLLYSSVSGVQWFCAGSTYFYCRSALLAHPALTAENGLHRVVASGVGGSCAGAVAGAFLPKGAIRSGGILFGVLAAITQAGLNFAQGSSIGLPSSLQQGIASLIPMKSLSDKEYEDLLLNKLIKIEAEISILDDQISNLRAASKQQASTSIEHPHDSTK